MFGMVENRKKVMCSVPHSYNVYYIVKLLRRFLRFNIICERHALF